MTNPTGPGDPGGTDQTELLATRAPGTVPVDGDGLAPGTRLGRYRIERMLGRGGMGEVYRAEQLEPVRRTVALKLLRGRALDARRKAHFEIERQVLAQMRHPAIAQIYDADTTPGGDPFFAMEFIDGEPVTRHCETHAIPLAQRIELFIEICEGVQHAHQKGVIHRDLKPGNLLVEQGDGRARPKIIDFGIATASSLAGPRDAAGTPDYMSPEQAEGDQSLLDTRSDVYSLGVVLCELLTGQRPATAGETMTGSSHTLRLPSRQLDTLPPEQARRVAQSHGRPLAAMQRVLRNELDWVVARAMQHDRNARYPSAAALADDLRRFLDGRPLQAVPASHLYTWRKFAGRHRGMAVAASVAVVALVGGLAMSLHGLMQARAQRAIAEQRSLELEKVAAFQQSMLENIDIQGMGLGLADGIRAQILRSDASLSPALEQVLAATSTSDLSRTIIEREVLDRAESAIDRDFADQPALAADLRESVARVYDALGIYAKAADAHAKVAAWRTQALGPADPATLRSRLAQATALSALSRYDEARGLLDVAHADAATLDGDDELGVRIDMQQCEVQGLQGDAPGARACRQALLDGLVAARGDADPLVLQLMTNQAQGIARMGDVAQARTMMEHVVARLDASHGDEDRSMLVAMGSLATMRAMSSDYEPAVALQRRVVDAQIRQYGREHPDTLGARGNLANMLSGMGETEPALEEAQAVLASRERVLGPRHPQTLRTALNVASFHARLDQFDRALPLEAEVLQARRGILGIEHPDTLFIELNHGITLQRAGRHAQALALFDEALPRALRVLGDGHPQVSAGLMMQGEALVDSGQPARAIAPLQRALELRKAHLEAGSPEIPAAAWALVKALRLAGRGDEASAVQGRDVTPLLAADVATLAPPLAGRREEIESQIREGVPGSVGAAH